MLQSLGAIFLIHLALQLFPDRQGKAPGLGYPRCEWAWRLKVVHAPALKHAHRPAAKRRWAIADGLTLALS
ncbi:hypothetical protein D3C76_1579380 [compost metagenome]